MNIALVSPYITTAFCSEDYYNVQSLGLAVEFVKQGHNVDIFTGNKFVKHPFIQNRVVGENSIRIIYLPVVFEFFNQVPILSHLVNEIGKKHYDIVQSSEDHSISTLVLALRKKKLGCPLIVHQGNYSYSYNNKIKLLQYLYDIIINKTLLVHRVDSVICKTTEAAIYMNNKGYKNNSVIPVGVNTSIFFPGDKKAAKKIIGLNSNDVIITYVGKIDHGRGVDILIKIINKVELPNVKFLIIGEGILKKYLEKNVDNSKVVFIDKITNNILPQYYRASDITLLPMDNNVIFIFGMVILESMACGTPVIASSLPGPMDIITNGSDGIVIKNNTSESFISAIINVIHDDKKLEHMGSEAANKIKKKFEWNIIARKFLDTYSDIQKRSHTRED